MHGARPKITVVIAARNAQATLDRALATVSRQSLQEWECIVCDDHSTDGTAEIARSWAQREIRFRLTRAQEPGVVAARNHAIEMGRGAACAIFDADDLMHPQRLEKQWTVFQAQRGGVVASRVRYVPRASLGDGMLRYESWLNQQTSASLLHERFVEMPVAHPSMLIETKALRRIGSYRERPWPEDYDLYLRLAASGVPIALCVDRLHAWRRTPGSASRHMDRYSIESFGKCRAAGLVESWLNPSAQGSVYCLMGYGNTGKQLAADLDELGWQPEVILELAPKRIGQCIRGAQVVHALQWFENHPKRKSEDPQLIVSVAGLMARREIRGVLEGTAWREGLDWVFAA